MGHVGFFTDSLLRSRTKAASNRIWRVSTDFVFVSHLVRFNSHCIVKKKRSQIPCWTDNLYGYLHCCLFRDSIHLLLPSSDLWHLVVVRLVFTRVSEERMSALCASLNTKEACLQNVATHLLLHYSAVPWHRRP